MEIVDLQLELDVKEFDSPMESVEELVNSPWEFADLPWKQDLDQP